MHTKLTIDDYIDQLIDSEDPVLYELYRETYVRVMHPRMVSGKWQGQILKMISRMIQPQRILEIGTFTGYSAICLAQGLAPVGHLDTIEVNDEIADIPLKYFEKAGVASKITLHLGDALEIIKTLPGPYDLVFMDGEKSEYLKYYHTIFDKLSPGGYILADNILWNGKVLDQVSSGDHFTRGILEFNDFIRTDHRIEKTILPMRDGILLIRKKD